MIFMFSQELKPPSENRFFKTDIFMIFIFSQENKNSKSTVLNTDFYSSESFWSYND